MGVYKGIAQDNVTITSGNAVLNTLAVTGALSSSAPVTKTLAFTVADTETFIIVNGGAAVSATLPAASSWSGRILVIKTIAGFAVTSASSNVIPAAGGAASNAIVSGTAGNWALLVSNGTAWVIMAS